MSIPTNTQHTPETQTRPRSHRRTESETEIWKPLGGILSIRQAPSGPVWILRDQITVYPARDKNPCCWRAVWYDRDGTRRAARATGEAALVNKLAPVHRRLRLDTDNDECTGAELIDWYLSPDRLPVDRAWSRSYQSAQEHLCRKYILPAIASLSCSQIRTSDLQNCINQASTPGQGKRLAGCVRAIIRVGLSEGYLTNPRLAGPLHWQALGRPYDTTPASGRRSTDGAQILPAEIPGHQDIATLADAFTTPARAPWWRELIPYVAAYSGLRLGELLALPATLVQCPVRQIAVDVKAVEIDGKTFTEEPKQRRHRTTIYPQHTPLGRPMATLVERRVAEALDEQAHGTNPQALMFPAPHGGYLNSANFYNRIAGPAYRLAGWRDDDRNGPWTWHSLRHTFCTTALNTSGLALTDVSALAGHSNARITMELYVGALAGVLQRAFDATICSS